MRPTPSDHEERAVEFADDRLESRSHIGRDMEVEVTDRLATLNAQLSRLLRCPPATLSDGGKRSQADSLVICGILGGKDVGKSTLIDALVGEDVSLHDDRPEAGAGTSRPRAYVHVSAVDAVKTRLAGDHGRSTTRWDIDVSTHEVDAIRDTVLVDFPDFDSEFPQHVNIVREAAPRLDRLIWVVTPRKIADREWVELFHRVAKDARNVHCVLNKIDEVVAEELAVSRADSQPNHPDAVARQFWSDHSQWAEQLIAQADCQRRSDHVFLMAAEYADPVAFTKRVACVWDDPDWTRYPDDRDAVLAVAKLASADLDRLRACVMGGISADQIDTLKQANRGVEISQAIKTLGSHYDLSRWEALLESACGPDACQSLTNEVFGPEYCRVVAGRLTAHRRSAVELADELFAWRVERWPILRAVYYPLNWLIRRLGRSVLPNARAAGPVSDDSAETPLDVGARTVTNRSRLLVSRFVAEHGRMLSKLELRDRLPDPTDLADRCVVRCRRIVEDLDRQEIDLLKQASRSPGWIARALLYVTLIWFPLVQPLVEGSLELLSGAGATSVMHGLYTLVRALRADQLILGFLVVLGIYVACLALMYARCVREVRHRRGEVGPTFPSVGEQGKPSADASWPDPADEVDRMLMEQVVGPVLRPVVEVRVALDRISGELSQLGEAS